MAQAGISEDPPAVRLAEGLREYECAEVQHAAADCLRCLKQIQTQTCNLVNASKE
jgi:hypothetical protein